jgi:hypothetical protein
LLTIVPVGSAAPRPPPAGTTTIPALTRPQGNELRDRILAQLRTPDDL